MDHSAQLSRQAGFINGLSPPLSRQQAEWGHQMFWVQHNIGQDTTAEGFPKEVVTVTAIESNPETWQLAQPAEKLLSNTTIYSKIVLQ